MAVGCPRVGFLRAANEVTEGRRGRGPEPECAVDVEPGTRVRGDAGDLVERVEGARVDLARWALTIVGPSPAAKVASSSSAGIRP